ncbi:hypothetical protein COU54_04335 [Candidatus Pacearchaeota archaeon CG10_big_fil_rev_8_21_14_0_10_31_24]|nr:MAG: hypothetical protein COU54_04335 [Candidatus Pacearchaeota archaeon CG10_big_fil_rev_8_21_14_0_10_31_24]
MKIGFLITYFYPHTGGAENNCYFLAKELAKKHEVHVFCSGSEKKEETIEEIKVHRSKEVFRIKYYLAYYPDIVKSVLAHKLDVLHVHGFGFLQHDKVIRILKEKSPETKIICTPHGPFMALKKYNFFARQFKNFYMPRLKKSLELYDKIIEVNPSQHEWMSNDYGIPKEKIEFVPNGISKSVFDENNSNDIKILRKKYSINGKKIISYLGRVQKYKGIDQVIKVLPEIKKNHPNVIFVIAGKDFGDKKRLEDLASSLNVKENVRFTGEVSEKEKLAILDISEIFVFPSEWEAFGIVVLEAMARGNAIISTSTEGGKYLIKENENGYLFNLGDIKKLREELEVLLKNDKLRKRMMKVNKDKAKKYQWVKIVKILEKVYSES